MKKVIVVSDTHRQNENYFKVLEMHKPDMVIHCGDVEGSEYALTEAADCPVHMVAGNNDFFSDLPKELELSVDGYNNKTCKTYQPNARYSSHFNPI